MPPSLSGLEPCAGPTSDACAQQGLVRWQAATTGDERQLTLRWVEDACTRFSGASCGLLAELCLVAFPDDGPQLRDGTCASIDVVAHLEAWCGAGDPTGCEVLAKRTAPAVPDPAQPTVEEIDRAGFEAASVACRSGDDSACVTLEGWRALGIGTERPNADAFSALESRCNGGSNQACTLVGTLYREFGAPGESPSATRARPWIAQACTRGDVEACEILEKIDGTYDPEAVDRAFAERQAAANLAVQAEVAAENRASAARAATACRAGDLPACTLALQMGTYAEESAREEALATLRRACEGGSLAACQGLANAGDSQGVAAACRLGDPVACEQLEKLTAP